MLGIFLRSICIEVIGHTFLSHGGAATIFDLFDAPRHTNTKWKFIGCTAPFSAKR